MPAAAPTATEDGFRAAFRHAGFRSLFGSSLTSAIGGSTSAVAVNWLVFHETGSAIDVAYVGLTGVIPGILLGLFAGVLADRYNRRNLMVTADLARMVTMAGLAATLYFVGFSLLLILAAMLVVYSFSALFTPASQAIVPRLVAGHGLEAANGVLQAFAQVGVTFGAALGGIVVATAGAVAGLGINAVTYALSAAFLIQIAGALGASATASRSARPSMGREMAEGIRYMREHRPILEVTLTFLPGNFLFMMVFGFLVVYAATRFGGEPLVYGYLATAVAGGAAAGALGIARWKVRRRVGALFGACVVAQGTMVALLASATGLPAALVAAAALGVGIGVINTAYFAAMQTIVPNEVLARVLSIDSVGAFVGIPGGLLVGGLLTAAHGVTLTYWIAAAGLFVNGLVMLALPGMRSLGYDRPV